MANTIQSTINHSSSVHEIAHAIKVIRPQLFIVDGAYKTKLHEALRLEKYADVPTMTMGSRVDNQPLVRSAWWPTVGPDADLDIYI